MSTKNVSLKSIASYFNVSINTVSHALRDMDDVSDELKTKIRQKAIELGYMPNRVAQSMKKDERPVIAIGLGSFINLYFSAFCNEIVNIFTEKNEYGFLFIYEHEMNTDVIKQCVLQRVDLLVTHADIAKDVEELARLNNIHIVLVGNNLHKNEYLDMVTPDNERGSKLAARYLANFCGAKRYVYIGIDYSLSDYRYAIFQEELRLLDKDCDVVFFNSEKRKVQELFSLISSGYTNLFFYNDMTAYRILAELDKMALDICKLYPDLHIIGFDGLCNIIYGMKQIATICIDYRQFAETTYNVIKNRLEQPAIPRQNVIFPVFLHQGRVK